LLQIVGAPNGLGSGLRTGKSRQQKARQNGNDGNNHQQLDESEAKRFGRPR